MGKYLLICLFMLAILLPSCNSGEAIEELYVSKLYITDNTSFYDFEGNVISGTGATGPAGATGATGAAGPNNISTNTTTSITGILKGDGSNVSAAIQGTDYALTKTDVGLSNVTNNAQVTSVSGTAPISSTGTSTPVISISTVSSSVSGALSSSNWTSFNNRVPIQSGDNSTVGEWLLYHNDIGNTGGSVWDYSGNGGTGTVTGATWGVQGRDFNGVSDFITTGKTLAQLGITKEFTILTWAKTDVPSGNDYLWGVRTAAGGGFGVELNTYGGNYESSIWADIGSGVAVTGPTGSWDFLAVWYDGVKIYLQVNSTTGSAAETGNLTAGQNFQIGRPGDYNAKYWDGTIGEVAAYNRVLSAVEVRRYYLATKWRYGL